MNEVLLEPIGDKAKEVASISEGLSDCFAGLILKESFDELGPQYQAAGKEQGPWMLAHGSFRGTFPDTAGFPNLFNPKLTWFGKALPYTYWAGQQALFLPPQPGILDRHLEQWKYGSTTKNPVPSKRTRPSSTARRITSSTHR